VKPSQLLASFKDKGLEYKKGLYCKETHVRGVFIGVKWRDEEEDEDNYSELDGGYKEQLADVSRLLKAETCSLVNLTKEKKELEEKLQKIETEVELLRKANEQLATECKGLSKICGCV
jgi:chromosome segregation ATPase